MPYADPPKDHRFKPGQSGNPGGIDKATSRRIRENAAAAVVVRERLLKAALAATEGGAELSQIEAALLKLLKDSEDRGLGAPSQIVTGGMVVIIAKGDAGL